MIVKWLIQTTLHSTTCWDFTFPLLLTSYSSWIKKKSWHSLSNTISANVYAKCADWLPTFHIQTPYSDLLNSVFPVIVRSNPYKPQHVPDEISIDSACILGTCYDRQDLPFQVLRSPSPPPRENKLSSAALFHTSLAVFFTEQDLRLNRAGQRNVMQMFPRSVKSGEEGRHIWAEPSSTLCKSSLLKGKLFPRRGCNETSLPKRRWI